MGERLKDKVALVIGAGSVGEAPAEAGSLAGWGNGKASSVVFAREGAAVFAVDLRPSAVADTAAAIQREGGVCVTAQADATNSDQVKAVVKACLAEFGRIDILQNNVGGSVPGGPVEMSEAVWQGSLDLNLTTAFLGCKHVLPVMAAQGAGSIINISSVAGTAYLGRDMISYATAKAGLIQFSKSIARQYAARGVRCNTVVPGLMHTPLVADRIAAQYGDGDTSGSTGDPTYDPVAAMIAKRDAMCPTGKMGDAWDVAYAALFLASDEARYITGSEITVDGGFTA